MKALLVTISLSLLLATPLYAADDGIHTRTLANGLEVVVKEDHSKPLAALRIYVRTGGAFEKEFLGCGISHYYEHLLSGGTTSTRSEAESSRILRELGGQSNAYTTADHTCYHIVTHKDFIAKAIDLYGDWMMNNTLDPNEVAREKKVIIREFNMGEDEPGRVLYRLFMETMYREHPVRIPTIGYRENFLRITREDLKGYYENRYAPNNTVVAVAGDVDPEEIFTLIENAMGDWQRRPSPLIILPEEPRQTSPRRAEVEMDVRQASVRMGFHTIDLFDQDLYALDMVSAVLSNGRSSRLFRRVVETDRLTDAISTSSYTPWFRKGTFSVAFQTPMENLNRIIEVVLEEIEKVKSGPVSGEELERAKVLVESEYNMSLQAVEDQASNVGNNLLVTGDPRFSSKYVAGIQSVTPEQVMAAARKYLDPEGLTVAMVRPISEKDTATTVDGGERGESEVAKETFDNGMTAVVKRIPGVGPVGIEVYFKAGLRAEPDGKNGVSSLAARLLVAGTASRSARDIARQVEEIGGFIRTQTGNNTVGLSITLARGVKDLPFAADLIADILGNATFPEEEFEKEKRNAQALASRQNENWQMEAIYFMREKLFGDCPYGNPSIGTVESVSLLTRQDVLDFVADRLRPKVTVVAVAGDVDPARVLELLRGTVGRLSDKGEFKPVVPRPPAWVGKSLAADRFFYRENQKKQATLTIAFAGPNYSELKDRAALQIIDAFTSGIGMPSGWYHNALRGGQRALVYFVHFSQFPGLDAGSTHILTQCTPADLKTVYGLLMKEIGRLRGGEFTDEEMETGRVMALVAGPYGRQTVNNVAQGMSLAELYGVGYDFEERFDEALKQVTREDIMRVLNRYFGKMQVAVTGPAGVGKIVNELEAAHTR